MEIFYARETDIFQFQFMELITFEYMLESLRYNNSTIHFGSLADSGFEELLEKEYGSSKKIILTDETVGELWMEDLITTFPALSHAEIIQIPPGEDFKSIEVCTQIWEALSEYQIGRNDLIINFGGGVITDLGGFVASLFKRGLRFINIPTTLLSQVDASVGGKTGVDLGPYKNQIGVFSDAEHVFIDPRFLGTLSDDQLLSGFAEMLKHGLIASEEHWNNLIALSKVDSQIDIELIRQSVNIKKQIVEVDHKETGIRKNLNFGHTIGHAIEGYKLANDEPILHGFAVAWGMVAEAELSLMKGLITQDINEEIKNKFESKYPKISMDPSDFKDIIKLMYNDKKNRENKIQFTLISGIGKAVYDQNVTDKEILDVLKKVF
ncbi:MAG: 3-dehydroquinate synthase [Crocinitomicaceae bacterium]